METTFPVKNNYVFFCCEYHHLTKYCHISARRQVLNMITYYHNPVRHVAVSLQRQKNIYQKRIFWSFGKTIKRWTLIYFIFTTFYIFLHLKMIDEFNQYNTVTQAVTAILKTGVKKKKQSGINFPE